MSDEESRYPKWRDAKPAVLTRKAFEDGVKRLKERAFADVYAERVEGAMRYFNSWAARQGVVPMGGCPCPMCASSEEQEG